MINILAVDDEDDVAALYKVFFKKEQKKELVKLHCVKSGKECIDFLNSSEGEDVHIVLCDINMPEMDGFEVLTRIRQTMESVKVFMISAYDNDEYLEKAISLGSERYFTKPVDFNLLKDTIQEFYPEYEAS
ncbi:putative regulatory protein [Halobacteriovorax marinus SJ]|uniref:Regulatory protein n=1 Tax=Halobacteriovorax marinus (strain ATCC BAA-682 / DSM 15412 / SJ) TaxID=862908 RepID=E1X5R8_HALMS|nr:response regulator [Halobacteriovorax marinus]CBW25635.1 putative regulatory protein [Halobacteriovorax marinus SJ]